MKAEEPVDLGDQRLKMDQPRTIGFHIDEIGPEEELSRRPLTVIARSRNRAK